MKIKTILFFFFLLVLVLAQDDPENQGNNPPGDEGNQGGGEDKPSDTNPEPTNEPKQVTTKQDTVPKTTKAQNVTTAPAAVPTTTAPAIVTTTAAKKTTDAPKVVTQAAQVTTTKPLPTPDLTKNNGTPTPTVNSNRDTVTKASKPESNWGKILLIGGGIIGALFVIGIVFNFINKKKNEGNDPINDINFVVDNQPPEPEMSTSMFNQQNDMYGQGAGYNDYDMQYGQYGAGVDNQYNQPAADPYGQQGYAQEVNYAQRTLSLNRNPAANNQAYQTDENAREVIYNHRPEAGDEIELRRGDQATIYEKYEDGWAWGYNITTGKTGMFPQQCLA